MSVSMLNIVVALFLLQLVHTIRLENKRSVDKFFYIYESNIWPNISRASIYKRDVHERLENHLYNGAGPVVNATRGEYHTDQYQLFSMIYYRALKDSRRTLDPSKATSFLIPYDFASDSAYYKNCVRSKGVCYDFRKCPLAPDVEKLLLSSPWYHRNHGHDHVLIIGMNYAMDHYILKPKCKSLISGTCMNCTKFAIDDYSYMYSGNAGIIARGDNWHAIPFPGNFHWTKEVVTPFPWENTDRPILVSYIGSTHSFYGPARRLRSSIVHYCSIHPKYCTHNSYGIEGTRHSFKVDGYHPLSASYRSIFCFQPIGDLMTRKGLFDSLLQGCIPVVFDALTASVMYTWHWEEDFWKQVVVEFPLHAVAHRYLDPIKELIIMYQNQSDIIAMKQKLIRSRVFSLQYSMDGLDDMYQFNSAIPYVLLSTPNTSDIHNITYTERKHNSSDNYYYNSQKIELESNRNHTWPKDSNGNYMLDAYDIVIESFLGWHSRTIPHIRNATVPECWDGWLDKIQNRCRPGQEPVLKI